MNKHFSLLGPFVSHEENKVLWGIVAPDLLTRPILGHSFSHSQLRRAMVNYDREKF